MFYITKNRLKAFVSISEGKVAIEPVSMHLNDIMKRSNWAVCRSSEGLAAAYLYFHPSQTPITALQDYFAERGWKVTTPTD